MVKFVRSTETSDGKWHFVMKQEEVPYPHIVTSCGDEIDLTERHETASDGAFVRDDSHSVCESCGF